MRAGKDSVVLEILVLDDILKIQQKFFNFCM